MAPPQGWLETLALAGLFVLLVVVLFVAYGFVYSLNQSGVRSQLEPRRQELLTLLAALRDESTSEESDGK
jgi:hypothetical protein